VTAPGPQRPPLKGLIVDWGGVLTPSLESAMAQWAQADGVDFDHFRAVMRAWVGARRAVAEEDSRTREDQPGEDRPAGEDWVVDPVVAAASPVHRLERGELEPREFERALAAELAVQGSPVEADGLLRRLLRGLETLDRDMLGLVRRAKGAGLKTALLSNSWGDHYPDELWDGLFDAVVISGRVGLRKPDERIFRHTADLFGIEPTQCVVVDDLPQNVAGAVAAGMVGVRHVDYATTLAELEAVFEIPLR
jgi:putative hydrolase of the HAD superfamily